MPDPEVRPHPSHSNTRHPSFRLIETPERFQVVTLWRLMGALRLAGEASSPPPMLIL